MLEKKLGHQIDIATQKTENGMSYHLHFGKYHSFQEAQNLISLLNKIGIKGIIAPQ